MEAIPIRFLLLLGWRPSLFDCGSRISGSPSSLFAARRCAPGASPRPRVLVTDQKLSDAYDILTLLEELDVPAVLTFFCVKTPLRSLMVDEHVSYSHIKTQILNGQFFSHGRRTFGTLCSESRGTHALIASGHGC